ncbi:MAG TPA: HipA family kinase [Polyangiaceae bacterium]|nr:HipA family kinase [Polyangiaceae bacterium]
MSLPSFAIRRVVRRIRGGSSSPLVVETDGGMFVAKLRGAGQGAPAVVAELVVGSLADALGLPTPERVLLELLPNVETLDKNDELADLLARSVGTNVGVRWLEGAREPREEELARLDDDFAVAALWLDRFVMNPDRTRHNPNVVLWKAQPWLIDHGAALAFQHRWSAVTEASPRDDEPLRDHVFEARAPRLVEYDAALAARLDRRVLERAIELVPDDILESADVAATATRRRAAYQAFLWKRLRPPRPFIR